LNAEVKRKMRAGRDNREVEMWVRIGKRDNHMLDNLMALVGLAMVKRLISVRPGD
jgi:ribosomal protein L39E